MPQVDRRPPARKRQGLIAAICAAAAVGMVGMAYAAVPFYHAFCQATGFDGTARRVERAPLGVIDRKVIVRFDANVRGLPWTFTADQAAQTVKLGAPGMAFFTVKNTGDKPLTGRAAYNVLPESAGPYFLKTQCFCFSDQTIQPGQTERFPVIYYVEPKFATDINTRTFQEVTLSYTFFPAPDVKQPKAG
ncbi:MAG: cytochrome c oxidase assembly protein [Caulobacteraceae bacterium]